MLVVFKSKDSSISRLLYIYHRHQTSSDALFHFFLSTFNNSELKDENISFWALTMLHMIYTQLEIEPTGKVKE